MKLIQHCKSTVLQQEKFFKGTLRIPCGNRVRNWSDATARQGALRINVQYISLLLKCVSHCHVWLFVTSWTRAPGASVHRIFQVIILEWVAIPFFRGSSWARDQTWVSWIASRFFTVWATRESQGQEAATRSQDRKKCRERDSALVSPERTPARHWLCFNISDLQNYVVQSPCPTHCDPMDRSTPGSPVLHCFPKFAQIHACWAGDAFQMLILCRPPSSPALNLPQHQGLFQWVSSLTGWSRIGALASSLVLPVNIQG